MFQGTDELVCDFLNFFCNSSLDVEKIVNIRKLRTSFFDFMKGTPFEYGVLVNDGNRIVNYLRFRLKLSPLWEY